MIHNVNAPTHDVKFVASGRGKAQCPADPRYPEGVDVLVPGDPHCVVKIPCPAPECGHWVVTCRACRVQVLMTAAGRPDDPRQLTLPCRTEAAGGEA